LLGIEQKISQLFLPERPKKWKKLAFRRFQGDQFPGLGTFREPVNRFPSPVCQLSTARPATWFTLSLIFSACFHEYPKSQKPKAKKIISWL
jgi:hypothetical protein